MRDARGLVARSPKVVPIRESRSCPPLGGGSACRVSGGPIPCVVFLSTPVRHLFGMPKRCPTGSQPSPCLRLTPISVGSACRLAAARAGCRVACRYSLFLRGGNTLPPPRALPSVFAANIRQTFPAEVCSWCAAGRIRNQSHRAPTHGGPMTICVRRRPWRSSNCWFPRFKTCSAAPRKTRVRELTRAATMADPARCH